jgi:hypothetical protein
MAALAALKSVTRDISYSRPSMSTVIRSAKSGSAWSQNELYAYNISVELISDNNFFLPAVTMDAPLEDLLDPDVLSSPPGADGPHLSNATVEYLGYLDLATIATQESFIDDFAAQTLKVLGFNSRHNFISRGYIIPLTICGEVSRVAQTDVCIIHRPTLVLLLLVEDKTDMNKTDAESQVVAQAIAAFQFNNKKREDRGLPRLDSMTIPCITMTGTRPTFYLVPVTQDLNHAVITGQYPVAKTKVLKCITVLKHIRRASVGMEDVEYRVFALRSFLRFKALAKSHWEWIMQGLE